MSSSSDAPDVCAMTEVPSPPGINVAVVGALATEEQALEMMQMRFVLAWNLRLAQLAKPQRAPSRATLPM